MVATGLTNAEIAASLHLSQNTVKNHIARIFDKMSVNNRAELTRKTIDLRHRWTVRQRYEVNLVVPGLVAINDNERRHGELPQATAKLTNE